MVKGHRPPPRTRLPLGFGMVLISIVFILAALKWEDVVRQLDDGTWILNEEKQEEIDKAYDRNDNAEQYVLLAIASGWYECYLCSNRRYWLNEGEIAKIGITTNPAERYSQKWLEDHRVRYVIEVEGDLATVRKAEIHRIGSYPISPENMARPIEKRLVVPVFHKTYSLR